MLFYLKHTTSLYVTYSTTARYLYIKHDVIFLRINEHRTKSWNYYDLKYTPTNTITRSIAHFNLQGEEVNNVTVIKTPQIYSKPTPKNS